MARNHSTVFVGNLSEKVTDELLYELFIQAGPVANVNIPSDRGKPKPFGFVQFKHPCSVLYAIQLFEGISMFGKTLRLNLPKGSVFPGAPPMGLPAIPRMDLQPKPFIQPLSLQGRLGPPVKPQKNYGRYENDRDRDDSRDRSRSSNRRDDMMPSSRHKKNRKCEDGSPEIDVDAIPDLLNPFGPPMPSHGPLKPHGPHGYGRRREHPYEDKGHHRSHHDARHDRHSHRPSSKRRNF